MSKSGGAMVAVLIAARVENTIMIFTIRHPQALEVLRARLFLPGSSRIKNVMKAM